MSARLILALLAAFAATPAAAAPANAAPASSAAFAASTASAAAPAGDPMVAYTVTSRDTMIGLNHTLFAVPGAWKEVSRINHLSDPDRLRPGQVLMLPVRLLHSKAVPAQLTSAFGDVRIAGKPASAGAAISVGDTISTGDASAAIVQLADGSHIKLAPDTEGRLDEHRRFQVRATRAAIDDGLVAGTLRLMRGSIEVFATKVLRARPLEISTPTAVIGVRGTSYRVRNDVVAGPGGAGTVDESATEVLEGKVHAQVGASASQAADVPAKFGAPLEAGRTPEVLPLPPAPDLAAVPATVDRLPLRFLVPGGTPLRVQLADDAAFDHIAIDLHVPAGAEVVIPRIADGPWHLRARRISPEGLEGLDAVRQFEMRVRPDAPAGAEPADGARQAVGDVALAWTPVPGAARYMVQVTRQITRQAARETGFAEPAWRAEDIATPRTVFHPAASAFGAADGTYLWRVAAVAADGRQGDWSPPLAFVLRPIPRAPMGHPSPDGSAIELTWGGAPENRAQVELARDPAFAQVVARAEFTAPQGRLARPSPGRYYARYRFVEPDGFQGAWSDAVRIDVPSNWHEAWRAMLPGAAASR